MYGLKQIGKTAILLEVKDEWRANFINAETIFFFCSQAVTDGDFEIKTFAAGFYVNQLGENRDN